MDYISNKLMARIYYSETTKDSDSLLLLYRIVIEYWLLMGVAYLWNKNYSLLDIETKEKIFNQLFHPSVGTVVSVIKDIDISSEFFVSKKMRKIFDKYPTIRNNTFGHGFLHEDCVQQSADNLKVIYNEIKDNLPLLLENISLVYCEKKDGSNYTGIKYCSDGVSFSPFICPEEVCSLRVGNSYFEINNQYYRVSPFIDINKDEVFYVFKSIEDRLLARIVYNQILRTGVFTKEWTDFSDYLFESDGMRKRSINGTIINVYNNNYKKYVDMGVVKNQIMEFLKTNKSSVYATVWGHGGVGKTATVQSICDFFVTNEHKFFDYIVFASAKDRKYNYYKGSIEAIEDRVDSCESLIKYINEIVFGEPSADCSKIIDYIGRALIIIDDYETFPNVEKLKVEEFIAKLDINHHKVLITTRANIVIGQEFRTNELSCPQTKKFLIEVFKNEFPEFGLTSLMAQLEMKDIEDRVFFVTNGRPLFIYQLAYIVIRSMNFSVVFATDIRSTQQAIDFLYGRIFDYLSEIAQNIFVVVGQLVHEKDLTNLIQKIKYILNLENDEDDFNMGLRELEKLRIIEILEDDFFRVYSKEILQKMLDCFQQKSSSFRGGVISRIKHVTSDRKLDNEHALFLNACAARYSRSEEEVVSLFRQILLRASSPDDIKISALLNLADYLFNSRGKKEDALKVFKDFDHKFNNDPNFVKMYATYSWATEDGKSKAIQVLSDFFSKRSNLAGINHSFLLELSGLLLTYISIDAIQKKEEIKYLRRYGEIDEDVYAEKNAKVKQYYNDIYNRYGIVLFKHVKKIQDITRLNSVSRQNVTTGLFQFVNICIRNNRLETALDICNFVLHNWPNYLHDKFVVKLSYIERIRVSM